MTDPSTGPVPVWVVDDDPAHAAAVLAGDRTAVDHLPDAEPFDLGPGRLVWPVTVVDPTQCATVLEAVTRGVAVVVRVGDELGAGTAACFVDELHRAAGPSPSPPLAGELSDDQVRLLRELGRGATVAAAARSVGIGARSASRRLAEARAALGVATTIEAVVRVTRSVDGPGSRR